jgi:hypothetical protein
MKLFAILLGALALVAGFTGGLRAYSSSTDGGPTVPAAHVTAPDVPPARVVRPAPVVKWAPCVKPAVRVGRACVTHVVHAVTLPAPTIIASPVIGASATTSTAPAPVRQTARHHSTHHSTQRPAPAGDDSGHEDDEGEGDDD